MPKKLVRGFLRSDGTPNFSTVVYAKPKELEYIMRKPIHSATSKSPIIRGIEIMITKGVRRLPITGPKGVLTGIVTATDVVNFLGGGEYFKIVEHRYGGRFFSALYEPIESIMTREVVHANIREPFSSILEKMFRSNVGAVPIVDDSKSLLGIITEHDVVGYLSDRVVSSKVRDHMTLNPVFASTETSIKSAAKLMVSNGFRRLPLKDEGGLAGIVTTMDIIRYIGEGSAFRRILLDEMEAVLSIPVKEIMRTNVVRVNGDLNLGEVAPLIRSSGIGAVLVEEGSEVVGILTERDLLMAIAIE
ncbi:MAG: CBS domain-containing protein [Candidatus Methanomethylicaceae archaeon]